MARHLFDYNDLRRYGLNCLTGEACAYSHRVLFDLNEDGVALIHAYLSLEPSAKPAENWNSQVNGKPAVASIMLSHAVVKDLMVFTLLHADDYDRVLSSPNGTVGFNLDEAVARIYLDYAKQWPAETTRLHYNARKASRQPSVGGRNVHQLTGREL